MTLGLDTTHPLLKRRHYTRVSSIQSNIVMKFVCLCLASSVSTSKQDFTASIDGYKLSHGFHALLRLRRFTTTAKNTNRQAKLSVLTKNRAQFGVMA